MDGRTLSTDRRSLLSRVGAGVAAVAAPAAAGGCLGALRGGGGGGPRVPDRVADPPAAVYRPSHAPRRFRVGAADVGDYRVSLSVSLPVRFWTMAGTRRSLHDPDGSTDVHFTASVWDPETRVALPETGTTVGLASPEGEPLDREVVYPMIGQASGFHYGDNFAVPGSGTIGVRVDVSALAVETTGAMAGKFDEGGSHTFEFDYQQRRVDRADYGEVERAGETGAVELHPSQDPVGEAPAVADLPGRVLAETSVGGARFVATRLAEPPEGADTDGAPEYLAVSARTPHNRLALPTMGLRVVLERDGRRVLGDDGEGARTTRTVDPDLGYHYGIGAPSVRAGDELTLRVTVPPQVARHEGYETAFHEPATGRVTLG